MSTTRMFDPDDQDPNEWRRRRDFEVIRDELVRLKGRESRLVWAVKVEHDERHSGPFLWCERVCCREATAA